MLTEIFSERYKEVPLWEVYGENERRLLNQVYLILSEQLYPQLDYQKRESEQSREKWKSIHKRLAMELGRDSLGELGYFSRDRLWVSYNIFIQCKTFLCAKYDGSVSVDQFIKERLSFAEIAFRDKEVQVRAANENLAQQLALAKIRDKGVVRLQGNVKSYEEDVRDGNNALNKHFNDNVGEFNERMRRSGVKLNYHNGFIQIAEDALVEAQIEQPFWALVTNAKWVNVDTDMKEAIDLRDRGGRDPAFYAAKALESTIKIISAEKNWTTGDEKGAANFVNNLMAKANGRFIDVWEGDTLIRFFSEVRNELGHGPGGKPMPELSPQQTSWAIEFCMSWIKSLIRRM